MVYVDNMRAPYRGMLMCHMLADSTEELLAMADQIGLSRAWLQDAGTYREHFDISLSRRKRAVEAGAREVDRRALCRILARKRIAYRIVTHGHKPHLRIKNEYAEKMAQTDPGRTG